MSFRDEPLGPLLKHPGQQDIEPIKTIAADAQGREADVNESQLFLVSLLL